jgi:hypothetical protein
VGMAIGKGAMIRKRNWLSDVIEDCRKRYESLPDWKKVPSEPSAIPGEPPIYNGGKFDQ